MPCSEQLTRIGSKTNAGSSVVAIAPPEGERALRNTASVPLNFLVMQVKVQSVHARLIEDGMPVQKPLQWPAAVN